MLCAEACQLCKAVGDGGSDGEGCCLEDWTRYARSRDSRQQYCRPTRDDKTVARRLLRVLFSCLRALATVLLLILQLVGQKLAPSPLVAETLFRRLARQPTAHKLATSQAHITPAALPDTHTLGRGCDNRDEYSGKTYKPLFFYCIFYLVFYLSSISPTR